MFPLFSNPKCLLDTPTYLGAKRLILQALTSQLSHLITLQAALDWEDSCFFKENIYSLLLLLKTWPSLSGLNVWMFMSKTLSLKFSQSLENYFKHNHQLNCSWTTTSCDYFAFGLSIGVVSVFADSVIILTQTSGQLMKLTSYLFGCVFLE